MGWRRTVVISKERLEKALVYLAESDETAAYHKAHVARTELRAKSIKNMVYLHSEGTVPERNAMAENSKEYQDAMDNYFEAIREYEFIRNKRQTESIVVEVWRSINSSRNKGNVV